jgi:hypothetical protein
MNHDIGHEAFWERVNTALDERRDPLEDPLVQRELEGAPERLGELEQWLSAASTLESPPPRARRPRGAAALLVVAAAAAALFTLHHLQSATEVSSATVANAPTTLPNGADLAPSAPASFVLEPCISLIELRATFTHRTADEIREVQIDVISDSYSREVHQRVIETPASAISVATLRKTRLQP